MRMLVSVWAFIMEIASALVDRILPGVGRNLVAGFAIGRVRVTAIGKS
jgi:hypothetical protein